MVAAFAFLALTQSEPIQVVLSCRVLRIGASQKLKAKRVAKVEGEPDSGIYLLGTRQTDEWVTQCLANPKNQIVTAPIIRTLSGQEATMQMDSGTSAPFSLQRYEFTPTVNGPRVTLQYSVTQGRSSSAKAIVGSQKFKWGETLIIVRRDPSRPDEAIVTTMKPEQITQGH